MRISIASLVTAAVLAACTTQPAPVTPVPEDEAGRPETPGTVAEAPSGQGAPPAPAAAALAPASAASTTTEPVLQCRMTVSETEGCAPAAVEAWIAPARERIQECLGDKGGRVRVRLRSASGKLGFDVEPNASLDPRQRQCILEALATLPKDRAPITTGEPRTEGFTSLVTIEW